VEEGSERKKPQLENEALWRQLIENANYRLRTQILSTEEAGHLMKTKEDAEKALANLAKDNETTETKGISNGIYVSKQS
jgi:hypothetical protein